MADHTSRTFHLLRNLHSSRHSRVARTTTPPTSLSIPMETSSSAVTLNCNQPILIRCQHARRRRIRSCQANIHSSFFPTTATKYQLHTRGTSSSTSAYLSHRRLVDILPFDKDQTNATKFTPTITIAATTIPVVNSTSTNVVTDIATSIKTVTSQFTKSKTVTVRLLQIFQASPTN
jgi:hypothetical protein